MQFIAAPEVVVAMSEVSRGLRHIYLDGRAKPEGKRSNVGYSTGRWEGNTLIVETTGLPASGTISMGFPHSDQVRVTERIHLTGPDAMDYTVIVDDPKALTRPTSTTRKYKRLADVSLSEMVCQDTANDAFEF